MKKKKYTKKPPSPSGEAVKKDLGKVYRGKTKYIDLDTKPERFYVVVEDHEGRVAVAKLKSIKNDQDSALLEINHQKYGLEKRTGIDYQRFSRNRMSNHPLRLSDKDVFPEEKERFKLSSKDTHRAIVHTQKKKNPRR